MPRAPDRWAIGSESRVQAGHPLPALLSSDQGRGLLPGAQLAGVGAYRAVVVPLALGTTSPRLSEAAIAAGYFGAPGVVGSLGDALHRESAQAFRLSADVLPVLVSSDPEFREVSPTSSELEELVRRALESWGRERDLATYDNDGADGIPGSADDDGTIDLTWIVVESPHPFPAFTVASGFTITSRGRRLRTGAVHVLSAPGGVLPDLRVPLDQVLATLGLGPTERAFPAGYPRTVSTLGRVRLGWLPVRGIGVGDRLVLSDGQAVVVPLSDLPIQAGFWLVERSRGVVFTSRVALRPDRHYQVTDSAKWERGAEQVLPLSYHLGMRGETVLVRWEPDAAAPRFDLGQAPGLRSAVLQDDGPPAPGSAPVRAARIQPVTGYRWVRLGGDSVRVEISGSPLSLP